MDIYKKYDYSIVDCKHKLDSYSLLIVSKYFENTSDYINVIQVCHKFRETIDKFRFNPIPLVSSKLFKNIDTFFLYSSQDKFIHTSANKIIAVYNVIYSEYSKKDKSNIKFKHIIYNVYERIKFRGVLFDGVTEITPYCFFQTSVPSFNIPTSIVSLGEYCFSECRRANTIAIPSSIKIIPKGCFHKSNFNSITLSNIYYIQEDAFSYCKLLTRIELPSSIKSIDTGCFKGCCSLKEIELPKYIYSMPACSFDGCSSLQTVIFSNCITSLGAYSFSCCKSLKTISLSTSLLLIEKNCFEQCISLISIFLPQSLTHLGPSVFSKCYSLQNVILSPSLSSISEYCFEYCSSLQTIHFPTSISHLKRYSFSHCSSLHSLNHQSIVEFGKCCFNSCLMLTDLSLPQYCFTEDDSETLSE